MLDVDKIKPFIDKDVIKVITGLRRCGKSNLLMQLADSCLKNGISEEQCIYINFEDFDNRKLYDGQVLHKFIKEKSESINKKLYLYFDEIQEVNDFERCLNSLRVKLDCDIYITGSNAKLLSGELATYLSGRYVQFHIQPFSFQEFVEIIAQPQATSKELFQDYLKVGGMPFLHNLNYD